MHFSRQLNCWSLGCSWSSACRHCSNYIFILNLTPGFNGLGKDSYKMRREAFKFWDLVPLYYSRETLRYPHYFTCPHENDIKKSMEWCWMLGCQAYVLVSILKTRGCDDVIFIFGTACQIYCYGRYCVRRSVSPQVPENPSGPLVDNFIVLPCVAFGVACVKLLPGVDRWNSLDDPRVIGPCHCEVWGWPRH